MDKRTRTAAALKAVRYPLFAAAARNNPGDAPSAAFVYKLFGNEVI